MGHFYLRKMFTKCLPYIVSIDFWQYKVEVEDKATDRFKFIAK